MFVCMCIFDTGHTRKCRKNCQSKLTSLTLADSIRTEKTSKASEYSLAQRDGIIKLLNMINNKVGPINFWTIYKKHFNIASME